MTFKSQAQRGSFAELLVRARFGLLHGVETLRGRKELPDRVKKKPTRKRR
jgi:hypothetical protein